MVWIWALLTSWSIVDFVSTGGWEDIIAGFLFSWATVEFIHEQRWWSKTE